MRKIYTRVQQALLKLGLEQVTAKDLVTSLQQHGVILETTTRDHCGCFPREKRPKKLLGEWTCMQCKLRVDTAADAKMLGLMRKNVLIIPARPSKPVPV